MAWHRGEGGESAFDGGISDVLFCCTSAHCLGIGYIINDTTLA